MIKFLSDAAKYQALSGKHWKISIAGHASKQGTPEYNMALSKERMWTVKSYIRAHLDDYVFGLSNHVDFNCSWYGYEHATISGEHPRWRAVRVAAHRPQRKPPKSRPPIKILPTCITGSVNFEIRCLGIFSFGFLGVTSESAIFEIRDDHCGGFFSFHGINVSVPIIGMKYPLPPGIMSSAGPWVKFSTTKRVRIPLDFEGRAELNQYGAILTVSQPVELVFLNKVFSAPGTARTIGGPVKVPTGTTTGASFFPSFTGPGLFVLQNTYSR